MKPKKPIDPLRIDCCQCGKDPCVDLWTNRLESGERTGCYCSQACAKNDAWGPLFAGSKPVRALPSCMRCRKSARPMYAVYHAVSRKGLVALGVYCSKDCAIHDQGEEAYIRPIRRPGSR